MKNTASVMVSENSPFLNFVIERKYRWIRHCLIITAIVAIHFLPSSAPEETYEGRETWKIISTSISIAILLIFFYINHYILIPVFLLQSRFGTYAINILAFCSSVFLMMLLLEKMDFNFIEKGNGDPLNWKDYLVLMTLLMVFIAAVSSLKLFKIWIVNLMRFKEFENNTLTIQLEQLKSQINPHFLFNTLNNINFLIDENPKLASTVLLKLSDILRNQLYLSKGETIALGEEITMLKNVLLMEEIRRDRFVIDFEVGEGLDEIQVPPFLFIPFIENVVKHGAHQAMENGPHVQIAFSRREDRLYFSCANSKKKKANPEDYGGLGLDNIRKRLDIIYAKNFNLHIDDQGPVFKVFLTIPIDDRSDEYRKAKH